MSVYIIRTDEPSSAVVRVGLSGLAAYAKLASPAFTGIPTAPTAADGTDTDQIATCAFVLANGGGGGGASVSDTVFGVSWDGVTTIAPSKNAVYDKILSVEASITAEAATRAADDSTLASSITALVSDAAFGVGWNGDTTHAPSKNAIYDKIAALAQADISGLTTADSPQFAGVNIGHASDTTLTRVSAGVVAVEGVNLLTAASIDDTAFAVSWNGSTTVAPSKNAVYDKIAALAQADISGLTTASSPQFTAINIGHASDTTLTRVSAGVAAIEGSTIILASAVGVSVQAYNANLTTIAGLTATTDNFLQAKASAWASRTPTQVTADLIAMVGDSGAGGTKGLVPAPAAGDAAASKFLKADGTWAAPGGGGSVSDAAFGVGWNGDTTVAPSKNAVYDKIVALAQADIAGLTTADSPQFAGVNIGHASDTTLTRVSAGVVAVEGVNLLTAASIDNTAYANSWDGVTTIAPSKNAVYDYFENYDLPIARISGNWLLLTESGTLANGQSLTADTIYWMPFVVRRRTSFTDLAARVSTLSAGGNFQLAIYASSASGRPTGSELGKTGNLSTTSTGSVSGTLGATVTLGPGIYFAGLNQDNATSVFMAISGAQIVKPFANIIGSSTLDNILGSNATLGRLTSSKTFGTWGDVTSDSFAESLSGSRHFAIAGKVS